MGAEAALGLLAIDMFRSGPALGRAQNDHRPERSGADTFAACFFLNRVDFVYDFVHDASHALVHGGRVFTLDKVGLITIAAHQRFELLVRDACQYRGAGNLIAVQVQDRQHRAVTGRIQEFIGMPGGSKRPCLGLAVADDACDKQVGIVESGAEGVRE